MLETSKALTVGPASAKGEILKSDLDLALSSDVDPLMTSPCQKERQSHFLHQKRSGRFLFPEAKESVIGEDFPLQFEMRCVRCTAWVENSARGH